MKLSKKGKILIGCLTGLVLVLILGYIFVVPKKQKLGDISSSLQKLTDGSYDGECSNGIVMAKVEVEVKDHAISNIKILKHRNGKGQAAEAIVNDVTKAQSLDVDVVSGATYSSYTILKAIENALNN